MTIDGRSPLGERLNAAEPAEVDLRLLNEAAGKLLAERMAEHGSREAAIISILNSAGAVLGTDMIHLDTAKIYASHPQVRRAVEQQIEASQRAGRPIRAGRAITSLAVKGAQAASGPGELSFRERLEELLGGAGKGKSDIEGLLDKILGKNKRG